MNLLVEFILEQHYSNFTDCLTFFVCRGRFGST